MLPCSLLQEQDTCRSWDSFMESISSLVPLGRARFSAPNSPLLGPIVLRLWVMWGIPFGLELITYSAIVYCWLAEPSTETAWAPWYKKEVALATHLPPPPHPPRQAKYSRGMIPWLASCSRLLRCCSRNCKTGRECVFQEGPTSFCHK